MGGAKCVDEEGSWISAQHTEAASNANSETKENVRLMCICALKLSDKRNQLGTNVNEIK